MIGKTKGAIGLSVLAAALMFSAAPGWAKGPAAAYASMAPVEQYLMPRDAEVALAKSAAPPSISNDATVLVLGRGGYETAVKGKNGFVCVVERSFMSPFDSVEFWNPKMRGPVCYNPPAARSVLPWTVKRTALVMAGQPKPALLEAIKAIAAKKALPAPEPGAMSYMLSRQQYLGDQGKAWRPHLMFHLPKADGATWGANLPGSPVMVDSDHTLVPEPATTFMVAAGKWSDGTPAAQHDHGH